MFQSITIIFVFDGLNVLNLVSGSSLNWLLCTFDISLWVEHFFAF